MTLGKIANKISKEYALAYDINPDEREYLEEIITQSLTEEYAAIREIEVLCNRYNEKGWALIPDKILDIIGKNGVK